MLHLLVLAFGSLLSPAHAADWPDLASPAARTGDGSKDAALVIAIEDYAFAQDLPGAVANGRAWVSWLDAGHGVDLVKPLFNQQAVRESMLVEVSRVAGHVAPGGRLWVIYIGHGAPSESGDDGLLVGVDAQQTPTSLEARSLKRGELIAAAEAALPEGSELVLVQDACFSGKTSRGDLAPGMAPLKTVAARLGPKVTVLSAARSDEYAGPLSDGTRPAFSYLVLGALRGWGDRDGDGQVSADEAIRYANKALVQTTTGRSQTPERSGPDVTLGQSGRERSPDLTALAMATVATPSSAASTAGQVTVDLGGQATDFAALAAQARAADAAAAAAAQQQVQAQEALAKERRKRLDAAASEVRAAAHRDFAAIADLLVRPVGSSRAVLEAWLSRYGSATVTIDGATETVVVAEAAAVREALARMVVAPPAPPEPSTGSLRQSASEPSLRDLLSELEGAQDQVPEVEFLPMQLVPAGTHQLGCTAEQVGCNDDERRHSVRISRDFWMSATEVTQGQYKEIKGRNPSSYARCGSDCPVDRVSWHEAVSFANALSRKEGREECYRVDRSEVSWPRGVDCTGYRLPTEAEWEVAARGRRPTLYSGSDEAGEVAWYRDNSRAQPHPVGQKEPNGYGLYDMSGNVWEWVWDHYGPYASGVSDPLGATNSQPRISRGGSWSFSASDLRVAARGYDSSVRNPDLGFRVVRTAD